MTSPLPSTLMHLSHAVNPFPYYLPKAFNHIPPTLPHVQNNISHLTSCLTLNPILIPFCSNLRLSKLSNLLPHPLHLSTSRFIVSTLTSHHQCATAFELSLLIRKIINEISILLFFSPTVSFSTFFVTPEHLN